MGQNWITRFYRPRASLTQVDVMYRFPTFLAILLLTALSTPWTQAADNACTLKPFSATYYGSYKGWRVDAAQQLQVLPDKRWQFSLNAENPVGSIYQQSIFTLDANQSIHSEHYQHKRQILVKTSLLETVFDWKNHLATSTRDPSVRKVTLSGGELDNINYQLALRCELQAGHTEFHYNVVDWDETDKLDFKVVGEERLETELGWLDTVVVKRIRNNNNRITTLWFAKSLDYQMVKLLQEEKKDTEAYLLYIKSLHTP